MDNDFWAGIAIAVVCVPLGLFCFAGIWGGLRKHRVTTGSVIIMAVFGLAFVGGGVAALTTLVLAPRHTVTLTITGKYVVAGGTRTPAHYYLRTPGGIYEATDEGMYDSVTAGLTYRCRGLSGWTGQPALDQNQATTESCQPLS